MPLQAAKAEAAVKREHALLRDRTTIVYALGQNYLYLAFVALCIAVGLAGDQDQAWMGMVPLILLIFSNLAAGRFKAAFDTSDKSEDPRPWARRFTILSGVNGAIWGLGTFVWFVPDSFPAQAFLVLAFLGMTTTEFVARGAYRPAFVAHATTSLLPLIILLLIEGTVYAQMTAILTVFFAGVLLTWCGTVGHLIDERVSLRHDKAQLIVKLAQEKHGAELARDEAQAIERAKSAFIASIIHEIRTPLNAILGMSQLLERSELGSKQREHIKVLSEAGRGLNILLEDVISLSQQGDTPAATTPEEGCDAGQAARAVSRMLQSNAAERKLRLSVNVASGLPPVAADPRVLRRILLKLVGNAIKFTERGGVEIAVELDNRNSDAASIRFHVNDTGPGIPHAITETLFQPFSRADNSYARHHDGAGVGLAVAKRLVESLGGTIGVDSEAGAGSAFWFALPARPANAFSKVDMSVDLSAPTRLTILCCVADPEIAANLERFLLPFGNHLAKADSVDAAGKLCAQGAFSLLIADAADADALAAISGQAAPILALTRAGQRPSASADRTLRWPTIAGSLYAAIREIAVATVEATPPPGDARTEEAAIDAKAFADLEKSLGLTTRIDILQSYMATAEEQAKALDAALTASEWPQAARLAQEIAGAAGGLGLVALTSAARQVAHAARDEAGPVVLSQAVKDLLAQHDRTHSALKRLYPNTAA